VTQSNREYDPRKSFLAFYETASKGNADNGIKHFIEIESENKIIKSEAYYCTKHGKVKGLLTIADTYIMFDPLY
jgi:major membrane immunogen (membrane-anchored lipoprotein)